MANFNHGLRKILINNQNDFPLSFFDAAGAPVAPADIVADAVTLKIEGFMGGAGIFDLNKIFDVKGYRGSEGTPNTYRFNATNVTVSAAAPANTLVRVEVEIESWNRESEFIRHAGLPGIKRTYQIIIGPGETVASFNAKLYNEIAAARYDNIREVLEVPSQANMVTAGATFVGNKATLAPTLDVFGKENGLYIKYFRFTGDDKKPSPFVTVTPQVITESYEGRNNYQQLKSVFVEEHTAPYHISRYTVPYRGVLYSSIAISQAQRVNWLGGLVTPDEIQNVENHFEIYINESACLPYQNQLVDFFNKATILSTANPALYNAPVWYSGAQTPVVITDAVFKA